MATEGFGDRVAIGSRKGGITYAGLAEQAHRAGGWAASRGVERVGLVDTNSDVALILLFGSGLAGLPFVPINYRLADDQLRAILVRTAPPVIVVDEAVPARVGVIDGVELVTRSEFFGQLERVPALDSDPADPDPADPDPADPDPADPLPVGDPEDIAIVLFTSGTTGEPKAAALRHRHLMSYVIGTVEFMGADEDEAGRVSVPPYHIAGASAVLTSVYASRRMVYLPAFTPEAWVGTAKD
jgi:fatty-acyl-CoA synthase